MKSMISVLWSASGAVFPGPLRASEGRVEVVWLWLGGISCWFGVLLLKLETLFVCHLQELVDLFLFGIGKRCSLSLSGGYELCAECPEVGAGSVTGGLGVSGCSCEWVMPSRPRLTSWWPLFSISFAILETHGKFSASQPLVVMRSRFLLS